MSADFGDVFEKQLEAVLTQLQTDYLLQWHAFPDMKRSQGGSISTQPSDYLVGLPRTLPSLRREGTGEHSRMMFLEAKASEVHKTLQKSAVRPGQRGFISRWGGILDLPYRIAHYSAVTGVFELWDGVAVLNKRVNKKHKLLSAVVGDGRRINVNALAGVLASEWELAPKHETMNNFKQRMEQWRQ